MIYDFKNEDALIYVKSLPSASIDLVLTDPPYADLCDLESQKKKEIRLNKMDAKVAASMKREEDAWLN